MRWLNAISPKDTISCLKYGPSKLLACSSWDGSVSVVSQLDPVATIQFSRPMFTVEWENVSGHLFASGGEFRISEIDLESETCTDLFESESVVLGLKSLEKNVIASVSRRMMQVLDVRSNNGINTDYGGVSMDFKGNCMVVINDNVKLFDIRNLKSVLSEYALGFGSVPQAVTWLRDGVFAVSGSNSQVSVVDINGESFVFKSNNENGEVPIYSLAVNPQVPYSLAAAGADKCVYVWDLNKKKLVSTAKFPLACTAVTYSQSNSIAVGLSLDEWRRTDAKYKLPSKAKVMVAG